MSGFTDDELRAALRLRAAGLPSADLRDRIRQATGSAPQRPALFALLMSWVRRPIIARVAAIGFVTSLLIVGTMAGAGSADQRHRELVAADLAGGSRAAAMVAMWVDDSDDNDDADDDPDELSDERDD